MNALDVLLADDDATVRRAVRRALERRGHRVSETHDGNAAFEALTSKPFDLLITDIEMPGRDGLELLRALREAGASLPTLVMSGAGTIARAVEAVRLGATDFLEKPVSVARLYVAVERALESQRLREENEAWRRRSTDEVEPLLGSGEGLARVRTLVARVAPSDTRVLITGENGVGKELVAGAIHAASSRCSGPFVKLNCAAVPRELVESELFGHERGAFSGAHERRVGRFELAHRGTLFLDEVGEMPPEMQPKLLRVLQEQTFERVGGSRSVDVDVRVIAATNRDIRAMVSDGTFREDLYYRLAVMEIEVPPLRARTSDLEELSRHLLARAAARDGRPAPTLSEAALAVLKAYPFPGNVRELQNVLERLLVLHDAEVVSAEAMRGALGTPRSDEVVPTGGTLSERLEAAEKAIVRRALSEHGNRAAAARALGVEKSFFYKKCRKLGLT